MFCEYVQIPGMIDVFSAFHVCKHPWLYLHRKYNKNNLWIDKACFNYIVHNTVHTTYSRGPQYCNSLQSVPGSTGGPVGWLGAMPTVWRGAQHEPWQHSTGALRTLPGVGRGGGAGGRYTRDISHDLGNGEGAGAPQQACSLRGLMCLLELKTDQDAKTEGTQVRKVKYRIFGNYCSYWIEEEILNCSMTYYFHIQNGDEQKINFSDKCLILHPKTVLIS
jgi:hypothetical protein